MCYFTSGKSFPIETGDKLEFEWHFKDRKISSYEKGLSLGYLVFEGDQKDLRKMMSLNL